jgi:hypothetical protein
MAPRAHEIWQEFTSKPVRVLVVLVLIWEMDVAVTILGENIFQFQWYAFGLGIC